jgi:hypothetical protein
MTTKQVFGYTETDSTERFNSKSRLRCYIMPFQD